MMIVYITIGNSDDKLSQAEWAGFFSETAIALRHIADHVHGQWASEPASAWQNACWCIELDEQWVETTQDALRRIAERYRQDSIAWAVATVELIPANR